MARNLVTATELFEEWRHGINGNPAVSQLEEHFGPAWRGNDHVVDAFFRNRKLVNHLAKFGGTSLDDATTLLEQRRIEDLTSWKLIQAIKKEKNETFQQSRQIDARKMPPLLPVL